MLDSLITSKTRVKLLLKFFMNSGTSSYLRGLAEEFDESTNGVRVELNRLTEAGFLQTEAKGRTKQYRANTKHPLFGEIHNLVKKYLGIDKVEYFISRLGNVKVAFITGDYAKGMDTGVIDLVVVGDINDYYLTKYTAKTEEAISRKIRTLVLTEAEYVRLRSTLKLDEALLIWGAEDESITNNQSEK